RRRHTISKRDWSSDVCSSDLVAEDRLNLAKLSFSLKNYQNVHAYLQGVAVTDEILELQIQAWQNLGRLDKALPLAERYLQGKSTDRKSVVEGKSVELGGGARR